jgi:hypothetical protein
MEKTADAPKLATDLQWVLAIDPGADGGLARLSKGGKLELWRMPTAAKGGKRAIVEVIHCILEAWGCKLIVIENVWGREGDGKRQITTFMKHVGLLEGAVLSALLGDPEPPEIVWVPPTKWQKTLDCPKAPTKKEEPKAQRRKTIHKNRLKAVAEKMFPESRFTLCTADAALLAEYGRRLL